MVVGCELVVCWCAAVGEMALDSIVVGCGEIIIGCGVLVGCGLLIGCELVVSCV